MSLIQITSRVWINPKSVDYVYTNMDGDVVLGCGIEKFTLEGEPENLINMLNEAIAIESAFSKVGA